MWGWSDPGDKVTVEVADKSATGTAGADGRWQVKIHPPRGGRAVHGEDRRPKQTVELKNVLVGDVWLCGGQSNMGVPCGSRQRRRRSEGGELSGDSLLQVRAGRVSPNGVIGGSGTWSRRRRRSGFRRWRTISRAGCSRTSTCPIGLVVDAVGGTPAEAWTSAAALKPLGDFDVPLAELARLTAADAPEYGNYVMHWYDEYDIGQKNTGPRRI